jgi:hypothetical protein
MFYTTNIREDREYVPLKLDEVAIVAYLNVKSK